MMQLRGNGFFLFLIKRARNNRGRLARLKSTLREGAPPIQQSSVQDRSWRVAKRSDLFTPKTALDGGPKFSGM